MSIQEMIDQALLKAEELKLTRIRSGMFSPSSFGRCYRLQYWNRKNEPQSNPIKAETLRVFKVGNIIHDYVQGFFPQAQREVKILVKNPITNQDDVIGFADLVLPDEVIDIKSCRSFEFKLMLKDNYDIGVSKTTNCLQVCSYAMFLNKPQARLIMIEKDALESKEFVLKTADWVQQIADELEILRGLWSNGALPAPSPRAYGGKECSYCNWKDKCFTLQGKPLTKEK